MRHLTSTAQAWIALVLFAGGSALIGAVLAALPQSGALPTELWSPTLWVFLLGASLAHAFPVVAPRHQAYHATQAFLMASLLLLSWPAVALIVLAAHAAECVRRPRPWYIQLYNIAVYLLSAAAAMATLSLLEGLPFDVADPRRLLAALLSAGIYLLVNHGLTAIVLHLARGVSIADSGLFGRESLGLDGALLLVGVAMATVWLAQPLALAVTIVPIGLTYRALRMGSLEADTHRDRLTGLYNARHFQEALDLELRRARLEAHSTGVVVATLDDVSNIVHRYGRASLDFLMLAVVKRLTEAMREYDVLARLGEDTVGLLLPGLDLEATQALVRSAVADVAARPFALPTTREPVKATISAAVCGVVPHAAGAAEVLATLQHAALQAGLAGPSATLTTLPPSAPSAAPQPVARASGAGVAVAVTPTPAARGHLRLRLLEVLVIGPGLVMTAIDLLTLGRPDVQLAAGVFGLVLVSELLAFDLYDRSSFSISLAPVLAAGLLGGPSATLLATWSVALVRGALRRSRWDKILFNASAFSLAGVPATYIASAGGRLSVRTDELPALLLATLVASAVYYMHTFLIAAAVASDLGTDPRRVWVRNFRWLFPHQVVLGSMGLGLAVATTDLGPLGTALFLAPPLAMRFVLKQYTDRTTGAVHRLEAANAELRSASTLLHKQRQDLALLSDLGQLAASEPRPDSLPALVVSRCVPTLGDLSTVIWRGSTTVERALSTTPAADAIARAFRARDAEQLFALGSAIYDGQPLPEWASALGGHWWTAPLPFSDQDRGWLLVWRTQDSAEDERISQAELIREIGRRLALMLERDSLLEEAATLDALRAVDRAQSDFVTNTAHELRTPLTSLQGYAELLRNPDLEPSLRDRWLRILHVEAAQLGHVLDQLLDASRVDSGRFHADRRAFDLAEVVTRVTKGLADQAALSGHRLEARIGNLPLLYGDPNQIERVLRNLITNAFKYAPNGGPVRVLAMERTAHEVEICVEDSGLGIPHEWLGRLFERFQRVDLPERASIRGAGLGLYIARQLVELNDGRIWASSDGPGQGSTFHFTLNAAPSRQRSQLTPTTRSQEGD